VSAPRRTLDDEAAHVLIVDDDRRIRDLLSTYLRGHGYRATSAASAEEARVFLAHLAFELIVLDVMMPGQNGFDFAAHLRKTSQVPILMLTARGDSDDRVRFGPFSFSLERGELRANDEVVRLTERERDILRLLSEKSGESVSREALSGSGAAASERTIDVQINRLRRKIEHDPANPVYLQTARGAGYRLVTDG
jgi:two-component system phosphate regulon response regulator OmpR